MNKKICSNCNHTCSRFNKGVCPNCYRRFVWKRKLIKCKRCERMKPHHAKGFCSGCYLSLFHLEKIKEHNTRKEHNIGMDLYRKITSSCIICGFDKIVDLHHLDHNRQNSSESNLIGLCPNHHKLIHDRRFTKEILQTLREKGFSVQDKYKDDQFYKEATDKTNEELPH